MIRSSTSAAALCAALLAANAASAITLSNGSGDGSVIAEVSEYGQIFSASFDPIGPVGSGSTVYDSYVSSSLGSLVSDLESLVNDAGTSASILSQSDTQLRTRFSVNQLEFTLTQTLSNAVSSSSVVTGSVLTQEFAIRNLTNVPVSFDMFRYMDGDLYLTDQTLDDGGGVIQAGGQVLPYQTDLLDGQTAENTFLGITATGGNPVTSGRFSVNDCCGLDLPLDDMVENDFDNDGVIDQAYDVTLALRNTFVVPVNATQTYTTTTIWGSGEVPTPGSSENLPLLPDNTTMVGNIPVWTFEIPVVSVTEPVWIDPIVAVGYTYTVTGNAFAAVIAPSLATIPDSDGTYTISFDGMTVDILAGETYFFATPVTSFTLTGIDIGLDIDPLDPLAFPTGVIFATLGTATVTQTPITVETSTPPIPLPASVFLMLGGIGALPILRKLRSA
jgi:hypothetical protein